MRKCSLLRNRSTSTVDPDPEFALRTAKVQPTVPNAFRDLPFLIYLADYRAFVGTKSTSTVQVFNLWVALHSRVKRHCSLSACRAASSWPYIYEYGQLSSRGWAASSMMARCCACYQVDLGWYMKCGDPRSWGSGKRLIRSPGLQQRCRYTGDSAGEARLAALYLQGRTVLFIFSNRCGAALLLVEIIMKEENNN